MHLLILAIHLLATIAKLVRPGGVRAVVAESLLLKHQLVISRRAQLRAPNLSTFDRLLLGLGSLFVPPNRLPKLLTTCSSGTQLTWNESWTSSGFITTNIAFTIRLMAVLRENDLANRRPPMPSLTTTRGGTIAAVCSRCQSRRNLRIRQGQRRSQRGPCQRR